MNTNRKIVLMTLAALAIIAAIIYAVGSAPESIVIDDETSMATTSTGSPAIACTMDARMCPDGSYVGRTGPKCQFVCPQPTAPGTPTGTEYPANNYK